MSRPYSERHGARFMDEVKERFDTYVPSWSSKDGDDLVIAFEHMGAELAELQDSWNFDVTRVCATGKRVYIEVTVHGRADD